MGEALCEHEKCCIFSRQARGLDISRAYSIQHVHSSRVNPLLPC